MTETVAIRPRPLTEQGSVGVYWRPPTDHRFVAHVGTALLTVSDIPSATLGLPWYFTEVEGRWRAVAILRLSQSEPSAFLDPNGMLRVGTLPTLLRMYPFTLMADGDKYALGLWQDPDCVGPTGEPLSEDGKLSPKLEPLLRAFAQYLKGLKPVETLASELSEAGVLRPVSSLMPFKLSYFEVDETKLRALPIERAGVLAKSGALGVAHAQLLSRHHQSKLFKKSAESAGTPDPIVAQTDDPFFEAVADDLVAGSDFDPGLLSP